MLCCLYAQSSSLWSFPTWHGPTDGHPIAKLEVRAPNLRRFSIVRTSLEKLIVESDCIEHLSLGDCALDFVKVIGKNSLRGIDMPSIGVQHLDLCDSATNLDKTEIWRSVILMSDLYSLLSKSSKLQMLDLSYVDFAQWTRKDAFDLETIAMCCPQLSVLCLLHNLIDEDDVQFPYCLRGSTPFQNVVYLNVGWSYAPVDKLLELVESLLDRCPRLKMLEIAGSIVGLENQGMAHHHSSISRIRRKCMVLNVEFVGPRVFPLRTFGS